MAPPWRHSGRLVRVVGIALVFCTLQTIILSGRRPLLEFFTDVVNNNNNNSSSSSNFYGVQRDSLCDVLERHALRFVVHVDNAETLVASDLCCPHIARCYHLTPAHVKTCATQVHTSPTAILWHCQPNVTASVHRIMRRWYVNTRTAWILPCLSPNRGLVSDVLTFLLTWLHGDRDIIILACHSTTDRDVTYVDRLKERLRPLWLRSLAEDRSVWLYGSELGVLGQEAPREVVERSKRLDETLLPPASLVLPSAVREAMISYAPMVRGYLQPWVQKGLSAETIQAWADAPYPCLPFYVTHDSVYLLASNRWSKFRRHWHVSRAQWAAHFFFMALSLNLVSSPVTLFVCLKDCVEGHTEEAERGPAPFLSPVRCPAFSSNVPFPSLGSHGGWTSRGIKMQEVIWSRPSFVSFEDRKPVAVFRGTKQVPGCQPPSPFIPLHLRDSYVLRAIADSGEVPCGRKRLSLLNSTFPDLFDVATYEPGQRKRVYISQHDQVRRYRFQLVVEGNCGWVDRTRQMLFQDQVLVLQQRGCREWFEDLLIPFEHFIPFAHNMENVEDLQAWLDNISGCNDMIASAHAFAARYLSEESLVAYMALLLRGFGALQSPLPIHRENLTQISSPKDLSLNKVFPL